MSVGVRYIQLFREYATCEQCNFIFHYIKTDDFVLSILRKTDSSRIVYIIVYKQIKSAT